MFGRDSDDLDQRQRFMRRAVLIGAAQLGAFGIIGARLFRLQVLEGERYAPLADENRISVKALAPARGRILDRQGEVLAANRETSRAVVIPALAGDLGAVLTLFHRIVPVSAEERERVLQRAQRQSPNLPILIAGELDFEQIAKINLFAPQLPGVRTEVERRRLYFHGRHMGHVVGYVGGITRIALDDEPILRLPGMRTGKSGVELGMEEELRGTGGHVKQEVDARGRIVRDLEEKEPTRGRDIRITIDNRLQARVLARMSRERRAALVALDVASGEVLAMASVPQFDNRVLVDPSAARELQRLRTNRNHPLINRTIRGAYPPGSTFKMVVALAGLEAGVINLRERLPCTGKFELGDQIFRCWNRSGHDSSDLHKALRESCDCYFYEVARRTGIDRIKRMAELLGLGQTYDCGIALQRSGLLPDADWKHARFGKPWLGGETVLAGVGQGYVLTTPLQLAVMTARLATGLQVTPQLVLPSDGAPSEPPSPLGIKPQWLDAVRRAMFAVVNEEGGTGHNARLDDGPVRLSGKTGTSQVSRASSERGFHELRWEERDHALFVGFAPSARPRYAIAAIVEHAGSGGQNAAPLVRDVMQQLLQPEDARPGTGGEDATQRRRS